jgi:hypothetical protein
MPGMNQQIMGQTSAPGFDVPSVDADPTADLNDDRQATLLAVPQRPETSDPSSGTVIDAANSHPIRTANRQRLPFDDAKNQILEHANGGCWLGWLASTPIDPLTFARIASAS